MNPVVRSHISDSFNKATLLMVAIFGIVLISTYIYSKIKCYTAKKKPKNIIAMWKDAITQNVLRVIK